jgi:hypothetical protein
LSVRVLSDFFYKLRADFDLVWSGLIFLDSVKIKNFITDIIVSGSVSVDVLRGICNDNYLPLCNTVRGVDDIFIMQGSWRGALYPYRSEIYDTLTS